MGRKLVAAIAVWIPLLGLGAAGGQGSGRPDPGFGRDGRVLLPARLELSLGTAVLPDGRIVLAGDRHLLALLPSGRIDRRFGDGGFVRFAGSPGPAPSSIASMAADSQGRVVVAASHTIGLDRAVVLVARYSRSGRLDPGFGGGDGIVVTDFGLPASKQSPGESAPDTTIQTFIRSVVVDSRDRIVLSGERAGATYWFKSHLYGRFETYVGRLTSEGEADRSFSEDGVLTLPGFEEIGDPAVGRGDDLYLSVGTGAPGALVHLRADGSLDPGFGENGARRIPRRTADHSIVLDGSGNLLLSVGLRGTGAGTGVERLRPDGSLDRGFGRKGTAIVRRSVFESTVLASDPRGGVLVAGRLSPDASRSAGMTLARLRSDGTLDRRFGRRGVLGISLERQEADLQSVIVSGSKALLSGLWCHRDRCGTALARIALGSG